MFDVTSAPEIYQYSIQKVLSDCEGARNMTDDIITHADSVEEHDIRLEKVLSTLQANGLTLNSNKCVYRVTEFMGFLLSEKGMGPRAAMVEAVKKAQRPKSASEVRSFLGLVHFSAHFTDDLATKAKPLRKLTPKNIAFKWQTEQKKAFKHLKGDLTQADSLAYFDKKSERRIVADASPVGLGAVLEQIQNGEKRVIYHASCS